MRIAYFTDTFLPQLDGVVTSLLALSEVLSKSNTLRIFAPQPEQKNEKPLCNIDVRYMPSIPSFIYKGYRLASPVSLQAIKSLKEFAPDIIHFHTYASLGLEAIFLSKILKKPLVGSFHTYFMEPEYLEILGMPVGNDLMSTSLWHYNTFLYNQCDGVITPSIIAKNDLIMHGVKKEISVIPNAIIESDIKNVSSKEYEKLRSKYHLKKDVILFVGRVSKEKNIEMLIDSVHMLYKRNPDISLLIVGDGPAKPYLEKKVSDLHLKDTIVFTGTIPHKDLLTKGYYQCASVFATTSTSELQPVSLIEAMYFGLPIVAVSKRGTLEMIKNVGLLSDPEDLASYARNLESVLQNKELTHKLHVASLEKYKNMYSTKKIGENHETLYNRLISEKVSMKELSEYQPL